jgi:hypothetical protein
MKVFCVRTRGYKTPVEFFSKEEFVRFIDLLGDRFERLWFEVKDLKEAKP